MARVFLWVDNVVLTGVMFTPCGRGVTHAFNQVMFICYSSLLFFLELSFCPPIHAKQNVDFYFVIILTMFRRGASVFDDLLLRNAPRGRNLIVS
jgi:hypothetical protein